MSTVDANVMLLLTTLIVPLTGIIMTITPFLMKKNECFTVTVPETALRDPYLKSLKRHYAVIMIILTVVLSLATLAFILIGDDAASVISMIAGILVICLVGYLLMLHYRHKVRLYKTEQHWEALHQETAAIVGGEVIPQAVSLKWNLLYIPILLITLAIGVLGYASMPQQIPLHMGIDGSVDNYVEKSWLVVLMPGIVQAFLAACFVFAHWSITRSKRFVDPKAPAASALAYGMFAHAQSLYLLIGGILLCALLATMPLSFIGIISLTQAGLILMIGALILIAGALVISLIYGQGGSRLFARMQESDVMLTDEDTYWKLGVFYFNPDDPSLFLPKRFGIGWTVNFARPGVWLIMVAGLVITVAFVVAMVALF